MFHKPFKLKRVTAIGKLLISSSNSRKGSFKLSLWINWKKEPKVIMIRIGSRRKLPLQLHGMKFISSIEKSEIWRSSFPLRKTILIDLMDQTSLVIFHQPSLKKNLLKKMFWLSKMETSEIGLLVCQINQATDHFNRFKKSFKTISFTWFLSWL